MDELTTKLAGALRRLDTAQMVYRKNHDLRGDGAIETGRAWDEMRRAGHSAQAILSVYDSALAAESAAREQATAKLMGVDDDGQHGVGA